MLYRIEFEVDNGAWRECDVALIQAHGFDEATEKLNNFINALDNESYVSNVFKVKPFEGEIFTGRHGYS